MAAGQTSDPGVRWTNITTWRRAPTNISQYIQALRYVKRYLLPGGTVDEFLGGCRFAPSPIDVLLEKDGQSISKEAHGYEDFPQSTRNRSQKIHGFLRQTRFHIQLAIHRRGRGLHDHQRDIYVMLLTESKFKTFTPKRICDAAKYTEVLVCLLLGSKNEVNEMVRKAVAAGGTTYKEPEDHGFMYGHGFQELAHLGGRLHGAERN
jgi:hypothetical protein